MDLNWIFDILTSPWLSLLFLPLIGYHCWQNVYDSNDLNDAISKLATNEATIFIPNPQDINENLTIPANITLRFIRGATLNVGKYSIRNATYKWTASGNEFYLELAGGGDPGLTEPPDVFEDGEAMRHATLGSLVVGEWNWGDDGAGFNTIYVRLAGDADPDGEVVDYVEAAYKVIIEGSVEAGQYQIFEGPGSVVFSGTRVGDGLLKDMYPHWRGEEVEPLEATNVKGGIYLRGRDPQAVVTFTIDDGNAITDWPALFDTKGVKASSFPGATQFGASLAPWLALQTAGWEIGSHGWTHAHMLGFTEEQLEDEIGGSKKLFESWGFNVRNYVGPWGEYNDLIQRVARRHYLGNITHTPDEINYRPFPMDNLMRYDGDVRALAVLKAGVDEAVLNEGWMIVALHTADAPKLTKIGDLIDYIQNRNIQILTMSEAEDLIGNLISAPYFGIGARGEIQGGQLFSRAAAPTIGTWKQGCIIWRTDPAAGGSPGWACTSSGTFSAATDATGDTTDTSPIIAGMADTSDFDIGHYVTISAGFPAGIYRIISKTATSITLNADANATVADVTVATPDPVFKTMANLAA